jgi:diketogulonate reductase-like aldo/keto reductase
MPQFGLGTYKLTDFSLIKAASDMGYKMYDCASFYANEQIVGQGLNQIFNVDKSVTRD